MSVYFIKISQEWRLLITYMQTIVQLWQYLAEFFLAWEMFQKKFVEKIKTRISFSEFF
jgi:hypothetical protein